MEYQGTRESLRYMVSVRLGLIGDMAPNNSLMSLVKEKTALNEIKGCWNVELGVL